MCALAPLLRVSECVRGWAGAARNALFECGVRASAHARPPEASESSVRCLRVHWVTSEADTPRGHRLDPLSLPLHPSRPCSTKAHTSPRSTFLSTVSTLDVASLAPFGSCVVHLLCGICHCRPVPFRPVSTVTGTELAAFIPTRVLIEN